MDTVFISQLEMETVIGVYDWERLIRQRIIIDLEMDWDNKPAGLSDDLEDALNYFDLSRDVQIYVEKSSFQLIEALAENVANLIHKNFGVQRIQVTVYKPTAVATAKTVGVKITRQFQDK